jgi:hypothetical protein
VPARGAAGASNPRRSAKVPVLGAVQATAGERTRRRGACFCLVAAWTSGHVGRFRFARTGRSADGRADLCGCDRDVDGDRGGEEEARIRQDAPSIAENDDEGDPAERAAHRGERR